jgi:hypothetical protein
MKWVLIAGAGILALILIVLVVGMLLPRDHVAGSSVVLRQPPDAVWRAVRDLGAVPSWWAEVTSSQRTSDAAGREVWEQKMKNGFALRLIVMEDVPPRRLVTTIDAAADAPFGGTWTYEVSAADGSTRLAVTEAGYVNNPLFRFMSKFVFGHHATQDGLLKALGRKFGEDVSVVHNP